MVPVERGLRHPCQDGYNVSIVKNGDVLKDDVLKSASLLCNMDRAFLVAHSYAEPNSRNGHDPSVAEIGVHRGPHARRWREQADDGKRFPVTSASLVR